MQTFKSSFHPGKHFEKSIIKDVFKYSLCDNFSFCVANTRGGCFSCCQVSAPPDAAPSSLPA